MNRDQLTAAMQRLNRHPDGKTLLTYLRETYYDGAIFDKDPLIMARNSAEHDLVDDILSMTQERSSNEPEK